jgi:hypothetical protein
MFCVCVLFSHSLQLFLDFSFAHEKEKNSREAAFSRFRGAIAWEEIFYFFMFGIFS